MFPRAPIVTLLAALLCIIWAAAAQAQDDNYGDVTQAPDAENASCGMIVYDWSGPVETTDHGFPSEKPPRKNYDWTTPINYAGGELFYRVEIFSQPVAQDMRLQLCFWQPEDGVGNIYKLETCGPTNLVTGENGQVVTWSREFARLWNKDGIGVDWTEPRSRASVAIKTSSGAPVSNYNNWNWNGEDPDEWYPLNMRFMAVAVPDGGEFCGWDYYLTPTAVQMTSVSEGSTVALQPVSIFTGAILLLLAATFFSLNGRKQS
jgi:hypothetical protein